MARFKYQNSLQSNEEFLAMLNEWGHSDVTQTIDAIFFAAELWSMG